MEENVKNQKRSIAYKVMIKDLLKGSYVKEEGWNPNYIVMGDGKQVSRVNVVGVIVDKPTGSDLSYQNIRIDDGSGNISLRSFENNKIIEGLNVGDSILIIGRPREFNNERYVVPEIIRVIENKDWLELRKLELVEDIGKVEKIDSKKKEDLEVYDVKEEDVGNEDDIISLIKKLDKGEGVDFSEMIEQSKNENTERIINNLIKMGELFEIRPGRIKVLE